MPGFDSGIELHNNAIDKYLPQSHAYILTFPATEPLIPDSIATFLRELKLYDMPVYIKMEQAKTSIMQDLRQSSREYGNLATKTGTEVQVKSFSVSDSTWYKPWTWGSSH